MPGKEEEELFESREERHMVHVHTYETITAVADCHQHIIQGVSAPARAQAGAHVHRLRVRTSFDNGHWHWFDVMTDVPTDMPQAMHTHYYAGMTSMADGHCHAVASVTCLGPGLDDCGDDMHHHHHHYKKRPDGE